MFLLQIVWNSEKKKYLKLYSKSIFFGQNLTQTRIFTDVLGGSVVEYLPVPILQMYTVYTRSMFICLFCGYGLTGVGRMVWWSTTNESRG